MRAIDADALVENRFKNDISYKAFVNLVKRQPTIEPKLKNVVEIPETGIGDLSDGYHTFNGLYEQRMILFAALVKAYKDKAWKSYRHEDGEYCFGGGWFIVGIDTPEGSYTYHYENKYWDMFDCIDLPRGKHWDGHTEEDAETRLMSLEPERWIPCSERLPEEDGQYLITVKYVHVDGYDDIYAEHGEWTDGKWDMFCFGHCGKVENIIAWMPLPEPYQAERRTDD